MAGLAIGLLSFSIIKTGNIRGKVLPAGSALTVIAVQGTDTLRTAVSNGNFAFQNIKTGTYTIVVKANPPYQDATVKNVAVIDSVTTDVGLIKITE